MAIIPQPNVPEPVMPWARQITKIINELIGDNARIRTGAAALNQQIGSSTTAIGVTAIATDVAQVTADDAAIAATEAAAAALIAQQIADQAAIDAAAAAAAAAAITVQQNAAEADLVQLQTDLVTLDTDLTTAQGELATAQTNIATVTATANTAVTNAATAQTKADTAVANAATAQTKANLADSNAAAASGLAASKAVVLYQTTAPGAAYQNTNTLWIDTTGGANTPKKWVSGTTWAAVTDKAATDAASAAATANTAAATAQTQANTATTNAATAQTAANTAQTAANNAQTKADSAYTNALAAQTAADTAQTTATTAQTSADGKNKIVFSTAVASGTGYVAGDTWFQKSGALIIGQWEFVAGSWAARTIDGLVIANIDAGDITVGTLSAARIAAGSLNADRLTAGTIVTANMTANAISGDRITAGTLNANKIVAGSITTDRMTANSISGDRITANTLSADRIIANTISATQLTIGVTNSITAAQSDATSAITEAATAQSVADVALRLNGNSINPAFSDWTGTYPTGFGAWVGSGVKETAIVRAGPNSVRFNVANTTEQQGFSILSGLLPNMANTEYITITLGAYLVSGTFGQSGVILDWAGMTNNRVTLDLATEIPSPTVGKWYTVTKVVRRPTNSSGVFATLNGYLMGQWSGHAGGGAAKNIIFDQLNFRASTAEEITALTAEATANTALTNAATADTKGQTGINNAAAADTKAGTALTNAATADAKAVSKARTFAQTAAPTGMVSTDAGDLWVDTDDGNRLYRWSGTAWTTYRDTTIATAQAQANTATTNAATADGKAVTADGKAVAADTKAVNADAKATTKVRTFAQTAAPTGMVASDAGDLWVDTDDKNKMYRWSGTAWTAYQDGTIADARTVADTVTNLTNTWKSSGFTTINGGMITTDSILAGAIAADAITVKHTLTGAKIRTAASGQRVEIDSTGLKGYATDGTTVKSSISTAGILTATDAVISGTIKSAVSGQRVELSSTQAVFYSGVSSNSTTIRSIDNGAAGTLLVISAGLENLKVGAFNLPNGGSAGTTAGNMYVTDTLTVGALNDTLNRPFSIGTQKVANPAERDATFPGLMQGNSVMRKDTGQVETYWELYNVTTNKAGRSAAGWSADPRYSEFTTTANGLVNATLYHAGTVANVGASSNDLAFAVAAAGGLTLRDSGVYAINWRAGIGAATTGRTFLAISVGGTEVARTSIAAGEDAGSVSIPAIRTSALNTNVTFNVFKTTGGNSNVVGRVYISRVN